MQEDAPPAPRRRPVELFEQEKALLHPMSDNLYDIATAQTVRASNRFRVTFDTVRTGPAPGRSPQIHDLVVTFGR